jgi:hypothetical protein
MQNCANCPAWLLAPPPCCTRLAGNNLPLLAHASGPASNTLGCTLHLAAGNSNTTLAQKADKDDYFPVPYFFVALLALQGQNVYYGALAALYTATAPELQGAQPAGPTLPGFCQRQRGQLAAGVHGGIIALIVLVISDAAVGRLGSMLQAVAPLVAGAQFKGGWCGGGM